MPDTKLGRIAAAGLAVLAVLPVPSSAASLEVTVFNPGKEAIFPVTSTIVAGPHEAMLVDAQFEKRHADALIRQIRATGKSLKYIYVSHSDPDFYFGLAEIRGAFPAARVVATAQTAYLIAATKDAKLDVWKGRLAADAPTALSVPDALGADELTLDGEKVVVRADPGDPAHSYLWIPSTRTILGGIPVSTGEHLWMADTSTPAAIDAWLRIIADMRSLGPARVIAGHFVIADASPAQLDFVQDYLEAYRDAASTSTTAAGLVAAMTARFPDLPGRETLAFGAKVFKGEAAWHVASPYPPIGRVAVADFGAATFRLTFVDHQSMSFTGTAGAFRGVEDTVRYTAVEVGKNIFMVYWHEPRTGSNVVHVQDWNSGVVHTNIAAKDGSFEHFEGRIRIE